MRHVCSRTLPKPSDPIHAHDPFIYTFTRPFATTLRTQVRTSVRFSVFCWLARVRMCVYEAELNVFVSTIVCSDIQWRALQWDTITWVLTIFLYPEKYFQSLLATCRASCVHHALFCYSSGFISSTQSKIFRILIQNTRDRNVQSNFDRCHVNKCVLNDFICVNSRIQCRSRERNFFLSRVV